LSPSTCPAPFLWLGPSRLATRPCHGAPPETRQRRAQRRPLNRPTQEPPQESTQDPWPLWRRENGGAAVRDAVFTVMPMSSWVRMVPGTTDRNCRLLLEHEGETLSPCGSSGRPLCCYRSEEWRSDGCFARSVC